MNDNKITGKIAIHEGIKRFLKFFKNTKFLLLISEFFNKRASG